MLDSFFDFCEELGRSVRDIMASVARYLNIDKTWIITQIKALPYILAACLICGAFWFITSALAVMFEY